jgi:enamine deaminase RidA (YjgF/YER057c/UK114 family)
MAQSRVNYRSKSPWEPLRGYSRAVQIDDRLIISGSTAIDETGTVVGLDDPYQQTRFIIDRARHILSEAGFTMPDVVRTRLFVTDMKRWQDYAKAHSEAFERIRPVSSIVQVSALVDPRLLIEMEFEAVKVDQPVSFKEIQ